MALESGRLLVASGTLASSSLLAALNVVQAIALAWIAAWQARAAREVRKLNGSVEAAVREVAGAVRPATSSSAEGFELVAGDASPEAGLSVD